MKRFIAVLPLAALAACSDMADPTSAAPSQAPVLSAADGIPGAYIVVLKDGANARSVAAVAGVSPSHTYSNVLNGFAASLNAGQLNALRSHPGVDYIEQDGVASIDVVQTNATWGIDRTDQTALPLSGTYSYTTTASNVHAYIIDTGVRADHVEFGGRASMVFNSAGGKNTDCNGHGTHVGGTVGGATYGIAKAVRIYGVKVLNCQGSGTWSGVISGMDWVAANHIKPAVANLSLGGSFNQSVNDAATKLSNSGVFTAIAAGNDNVDACNYSPASAANVTTVAASTSSDAKASYSNWGSCVELYAPGSSITSAWSTSSTAIKTISGTSMATPHVAGVAALYKATHGDASWSTVNNWLTSNATVGVITGNVTGTPNLLLFKSTL
ncbi:MAG: S8 family peptidase [Gemmatimonadetes bacterium]|nr:S8 family peptidase [Gemmatimonadota bacterium]